MSKPAFDRIVRLARGKALGIIKSDIKAQLPKGWSAVLGVGWGVVIYDAHDEGVARDKWPAGLVLAVALADEFNQIFGYGNERIKRN